MAPKKNSKRPKKKRKPAMKPFPDKRNTVDPVVGSKLSKKAKPRTWGGLSQ